MRRSETLDRMAASTDPGRRLAWQTIGYEIGTRGYRIKTFLEAQQEKGLSRSTLYQFRDGVSTVQPMTVRIIEAKLGFPPHLLDMIDARDETRIRNLPSKKKNPARGIDDDLRSFILLELQLIDEPPARRSTDTA